MKKPRPFIEPGLSSWVFILFALIFLIQAAPGLWLNSLTNDEPVEITNGYYSLIRGDVAAPHNYSVFATAFCAVPLLAMTLKTFPMTGDVFDRAHAFLFNWNLDKLDQITLAARSGSLLLGLLLGYLLFRSTKTTAVVSCLVLFFWALNPVLLALSGLAKSDMPAVVLFYLAVILYQKSTGEKSLLFPLAAGFAGAFAVTSKFSCLVLAPICLALEMLEWEHREGGGKSFKTIVRKWSAVGLAFFIGVSLIYLPASFRPEGFRWPFGFFMEKVQALTHFDEKTFPVYFLGQSGFRNHWYYFPAAFILKSPIPYVLLFLLGSILSVLKKIRLPAWYWVPPLVFSAAMLPHLNEGIRFLAPALPFTFLIAAQGGAWLWKRKPEGARFKRVLGFLLGWQLISVAACFPDHLSYFNDAVKPERKIHYLADSNLDWGQDLKRLSTAARTRGWPRVKLAYAGGVDPAVYGLDWEPWTEADLEGPQPGTVYAVNAGFIQLAPSAYPSTRVIAESWIGRVSPTGRIKDSWYYFEFPGPRKTNPSSSYLISAPFLQLRGYTAFSPAPGKIP